MMNDSKAPSKVPNKGKICQKFFLPAPKLIFYFLGKAKNAEASGSSLYKVSLNQLFYEIRKKIFTRTPSVTNIRYVPTGTQEQRQHEEGHSREGQPQSNAGATGGKARTKRSTAASAGWAKTKSTRGRKHRS